MRSLRLLVPLAATFTTLLVAGSASADPPTSTKTVHLTIAAKPRRPLATVDVARATFQAPRRELRANLVEKIAGATGQPPF